MCALTTVNLTLEIGPCVKAMEHPRVMDNNCVKYYLELVWHQEQSSTLTTGPKVLASKNWLGLVKIGNLEVRRAYKHLTVTCYTSLNLPHILNYFISFLLLYKILIRWLHLPLIKSAIGIGSGHSLLDWFEIEKKLPIGPIKIQSGLWKSPLWKPERPVHQKVFHEDCKKL